MYLQTGGTGCLDQKPKSPVLSNARHTVDGALDVLAPGELLIESHQDHAHNDRHDNHQCCRRTIYAQGHRQVGLSLLWLRVHVTGVDRARVADGVDKRQRCRSLGGRARQRIGDPSQSNNIARVHTWYHEHHGHVAGRCRVSSGCENKGKHTNAERYDNVEEALACAVRMPGIKVGGYDRKHVGWRRKQQRLDVRISKRLHHGWEEVCDRC